MNTPRIRRALVASTCAFLIAASVASSPAAAFVVFDPSNYAENVLQAARSLEQINNQITSLQNEAQMLINQAKNLTKLPYSALQSIEESISRTQELLGEAQRLAYDIQEIESEFGKLYSSVDVSASDKALINGAHERWENSVAGFEDALKVQAGVVDSLDETRTQLGNLVTRSQGAAGALQAAQAGNQLLALQAKQLADLTAAIAAQTGVIDHFLSVFTQYIDSGFGLLGGEVGYLASTLIVIDVTLAALFWAWGAEQDITARLIKKTLFVGLFAWLISNWNDLARIVFESFAGLGLQASGSSLSQAEFLQPGRVAQVGLDAGKPILEAVGQLMGFVSFFENFVQIAVLMMAWLIVLIAFFVLAIQLFVTLIEFKLTTLAGFVLIPFGLFGQTAFLAERVLGNVVASGVKALVLAVIVGIGSTLFAEFTQGFGPDQPTLEDAMAIVLAALALLGLGIFGPGIANGLISGGPQLGAGAAVGTGIAAGATLAAGAAGARLAGGAAISAARGGASVVGGAVNAYRAGASASPGGGAGAIAAGTANVARAGGSAAAERVRSAFLSSSASGPAGASGGPSASAAPGWARRMRREQALSHGVTAAAHALRSGDHAGGGSSLSLKQDDR